MKNCLTLIFFLFFSVSELPAQLGFTVAQTQGFAKEWQVMVENYITGRRTDFLKYGNTATIHYNFPLSNPQWQFEPAIYGTRAHMIHYGHDFDVYSIGILPNLNYAPFLKSSELADSKRSIFYVQASPGLGYVRQRYKETVFEDGHLVERDPLTDKHLSISLGLNLMLELKLTQLLTVSPTAGIRYFPDLEWDGFSDEISNGLFDGEYDTVDWRQFSFGLRIGLNLGKSG